MIIREQPDRFIYLTQQDHAYLSGLMAERWLDPHFPDPARRPEVTLAIHEHDRGWQAPDAAPFWNVPQQAPYFFLDYPTPPKVVHYQHGLDETERLSAYAGLLCSLHFSTFFDPDKPGPGADFVRHEAQRQQRLRAQLLLTTPAAKAALDYHLRLLKLLDNLSLYLCLNEPGAAEHAWYRAGIPYSEGFTADGQLLQAAWRNAHAVHLAPFPFDQPFAVPLRYRELPKAQIAAEGLSKCFDAAPVLEHRVWLREA